MTGGSSTGNGAVGNGAIGSASMGSSPFASASSPSSVLTTGSALTTTGSKPLRQTIGVSPAPVRQKPFLVFGGTGNGGGESYDLQTQNVYSLLQQRGVQYPNVLYPYSAAKPSFIIERLIVLSVTGASGNASSGNAGSGISGGKGGALSSPGSGSPSGAGGAAQAKGPTDAERTVTAVRRVVDAEISRGSGRLGGTHRRKLQFLRAALVSLEQAQVGSAVASAIGGASGKDSGIVTGQGSNGQGQSKIDPREIFYSNARAYARTADRLTPRGF